MSFEIKLIASETITNEKTIKRRYGKVKFFFFNNEDELTHTVNGEAEKSFGLFGLRATVKIDPLIRVNDKLTVVVTKADLRDDIRCLRDLDTLNKFDVLKIMFR